MVLGGFGWFWVVLGGFGWFRVLVTATDRALIGMHKLTNRFHVAVRLFSNRSQMTSKCGKNKKVAHEAHITEQTHGNMESICFI